MQRVTPEQQPRPADDWLLVEAEELTWLIPRREVLHLGPLTTGPSPEGACGWVHHNECDYPAVYWNRVLHLQTQAPQTCQSGVILQHHTGAIALACQQLRKLTHAPNWQPLPPSMQGRRQPFDTIAVIGRQAAGQLTAERLAAALPGLQPRTQADHTSRTGTGA